MRLVLIASVYSDEGKLLRLRFGDMDTDFLANESKTWEITPAEVLNLLKAGNLAFVNIGISSKTHTVLGIGGEMDRYTRVTESGKVLGSVNLVKLDEYDGKCRVMDHKGTIKTLPLAVLLGKFGFANADVVDGKLVPVKGRYEEELVEPVSYPQPRKLEFDSAGDTVPTPEEMMQAPEEGSLIIPSKEFYEMETPYLWRNKTEKYVVAMEDRVHEGRDALFQALYKAGGKLPVVDAREAFRQGFEYEVLAMHDPEDAQNRLNYFPVNETGALWQDTIDIGFVGTLRMGELNKKIGFENCVLEDIRTKAVLKPDAMVLLTADTSLNGMSIESKYASYGSSMYGDNVDLSEVEDKTCPGGNCENKLIRLLWSMRYASPVFFSL